jgi:hypothetical protein
MITIMGCPPHYADLAGNRRRVVRAGARDLPGTGQCFLIDFL